MQRPTELAFPGALMQGERVASDCSQGRLWADCVPLGSDVVRRGECAWASPGIVSRRIESSKRAYQPATLDPAVYGGLADVVPEVRNDSPSLPDPAYLYACGLRWEQEGDAPAGWELVQALRSADSRTRAIAAALLAKTEDAGIPMRAVRRAGRAQRLTLHDEGERAQTDAMKTPYGLTIIEDCTACKVRKN